MNVLDLALRGLYTPAIYVHVLNIMPIFQQGQLPSARSSASSVLIGDRIFYYGGGDEQTAYYDDMHVLNISECLQLFTIT